MKKIYFLILFVLLFLPQFIFAASPSLKLQATSDVCGVSKDFVLDGNRLYVADGIYGFKIIDVSNPVIPSLIGSLDIGSEAWGVFISGNYAYVADYENGLIIIDIADPAQPVAVGSYNTDSLAFRVYVSGDYAYVADYEDGVIIIDISDPTQLNKIGSYNTAGLAYGVFVSGDYAYVADWDSGLQIIDISNPESPVLTGNYDTDGWSYRVDVSDNYAYVADGILGMKIINVADPSSPVLVSEIDTNGSTRAIYLFNNYAYLADLGEGIDVVNLINIAQPALHTELVDSIMLNNTRDIVITANGTIIAASNQLQIIYADMDGDLIYNNEDCNDFDANISALQTYYLDQDGDGLGDPNNSILLCSLTAPSGYVNNADDLDDQNKDILSVSSASHGNVLITYINNDTYLLDVYTSETMKKTILKQYNEQYYLALTPSGKKVSLIDVYHRQILSTKTLSKNIKYSINKIKIKKIRNKNFAVITAKKDNSILLSLVKLNISAETIKNKDQAVLSNSEIKPKKTKINKNYIYLRNINGAELEKYLVTKKYLLEKK